MRITLALILTLVLDTIAQDTSTTDALGSIISHIRNGIPRTTFQGVTLKPQFDPSNGDYWQSIGVLAMLGIVCSILAFLGNVMIPILTSFGFLGGTEPQEGNLKKIAPRKRPYPSSHRTILFALFLLAFMIVTTLVAFGYLSNDVFNSYFENARVTIVNTGNRMYNDSINMQTEFTNLLSLQGSNAKPLLPVIVSVLGNIVQSQEQVQNTTIIRDVGRVNKVRYYLLCFLFALLLLPPILGLLGGLVLWKDCAGYSKSIAWYMLIISWIGFTIHFILAVMAGDVCNEMTNYMQYGNTTNMTTVPTSNSQGLIPSFGNSIQALVVSYLSIVQHCGNKTTNNTFILGITYDQSDVTAELQSINQQLHDSDPNHGTYSYDLSNVNNCLSLSFVQSNYTLQQELILSINISYALNNIVTLLPTQNNCSYVETAYQDVQVYFCSFALNALDVIWVVFFFLGIVNVPVIVCGGLGYKRFRKRKYIIPKVKKDPRNSGVYVQVHSV